MFRRLYRRALPLLLASPFLIAAISLDVDDQSSIKSAAQIIAKDLIAYYKGDDDGVGLFGYDYYWYEVGAVWSGMIDYWAYTGDDQYNGLIQQALAGQRGPYNDYMPPNQTKAEGNDDQGFWALAAMNAAEKGFPNASGSPTWLDLAKTVFDSQVRRWDTKTCNGGLRWQIFAFNSGYDYKNSISNGVFFQLAARLASFTGNQTYSDWAKKSYDWTKSIGLINDDFYVYDGALVAAGCKSPNRVQWSYVSACFTYGSAVMYNYTSDPSWRDRTNSFLNATQLFFKNENSQGVMTEIACEPFGTCNDHIYPFKGYTAQWLGAIPPLAPYASDSLLPSLRTSAQAAAKQCSGGKNQTACGFHWTASKYDGTTGLGQELSALNVVLANLAVKSTGPANANSTSTSTGTTSAGSRGQGGSSANSTVSASPASQPSGSGSAGLGSLVTGNALLWSVLVAALYLL